MISTGRGIYEGAPVLIMHSKERLQNIRTDCPMRPFSRWPPATAKLLTHSSPGDERQIGKSKPLSVLGRFWWINKEKIARNERFSKLSDLFSVFFSELNTRESDFIFSIQSSAHIFAHFKDKLLTPMWGQNFELKKWLAFTQLLVSCYHKSDFQNKIGREIWTHDETRGGTSFFFIFRDKRKLMVSTSIYVRV